MRSLPGSQREMELSGSPLTISYVEAGVPAGPPTVVLVHGLGGRWQHWEKVIPAIAERRRVVAIDLPGFGRSSLPTGPLELSEIADTLAALIRELSLDRVVLVGHSLGGPLAVIFATRHRALAERLVLVCGTVQTFQRTLAGRIRPWFTRPHTAVATVAELIYTAVPVPRVLRGAIARSRIGRVVALWPFVRSPQRLSPEDAELLIEGAGARGVLPTAAAVARASGWEHLCAEVPVTLINGDHDRIAPLSDLRDYAARVDQALIVKGTGHLPMLERPEAFVAALSQAIGGP